MQRDIFIKTISNFDGWKLNGTDKDAYPGIISICFPDLYSESLIYAMEDFAISRGFGVLIRCMMNRLVF